MDNQDRMKRLSAQIVESFGAVPFVLVVHPGPSLPVMSMSPLPERLQVELLRHLVQSFESASASPFPGGHTDTSIGFVSAGDMRAAAICLLVAAKQHTAGAPNVKPSPDLGRSCASVANWLEACADTLDAKHDPSKCECGATLANITARGLSAALCPECDRDHLDELQHG